MSLLYKCLIHSFIHSSSCHLGNTYKYAFIFLNQICFELFCCVSWQIYYLMFQIMAVTTYFWFIHHSEDQVEILSSVYFGKFRSSWYYTNSEHLLTVHILYTAEISMIVCFSNHSHSCIINPMMPCKVLDLTASVNTKDWIKSIKWIESNKQLYLFSLCLFVAICNLLVLIAKIYLVRIHTIKCLSMGYVIIIIFNQSSWPRSCRSF